MSNSPSTTEKKENIFSRLSHKLHKHNNKQQTENLPPKPFEKYKRKKETSPSVPQSSISTSSPKITYSRKIRIPHLKTFKRYTAALLFLINAFLLFITATTNNVMSLPMTLFFLGNTFITLDYLYKTSSWRLTKKHV